MSDLRQQGFTLIEVLIAMAITVIILAGAFMTFSNLVTGLEVLRGATETSHSMNRMWMFVSRDIRQFVNRPIRDEFGELESAMWGGDLAGGALNLTRGGWHNGRLQPRSNLERVRYVLDEEVLYRESYAVLDRTDVNEPRRVALLEGVDSFEVRFLSQGVSVVPGEEWDLEKWPVNWGIDRQQNSTVNPPAVVAFILEIQGLGEIHRLYEVPGA